MKKFLLYALSIYLIASVHASASSTPYSGLPVTVPGIIEAEAFDNGGEGVAYHDSGPNNAGGAYRQTGVDIEASAAASGGYDVGWISAGEWLNYTVNVVTAGTYTVQVRVASPAGGRMHVGFNTASNVWQSLTVPATGGWQTWTTVSFAATLGAGTQQMTVLFDTSGFNFDSVTIGGGPSASAPSAAAPSASGAYHGAPAVVPGTIQAEDFDNGGEGVAYHDNDAGNNGGAYRQTGVDIESMSGGGYDVGWIASGEWMNYTVAVASAGTYTVQLRVASPNGGSMHVGFNGASNVWQSVAVPKTGSWQTWSTVTINATLAAGTQQMTLLSDTGGYNLDAVTVAAGGSAVSGGGLTPLPSTPPPASTTDVAVADWNIQVNDSSAAHARTAIDRLVALSPQPEVIVLEEAHQSMYSTYLNELASQTGRTWTGVFQTHCPPGAWTGSSCSTAEDEGVGLFTSLPVQNTSVGYLPYADAYHSARALVRAAITVNGGTLQVFGTHLQVGDATARANSMVALKNWAAGYSKPQLVAGDFNADPDQIDTQAGMASAFVDSWSVVGSGSGYTAFGPSPTMKLDYWFSDAGGKAQPQWSMVVTSTGTTSDHFPIVAGFRVSQ